MNQRMLRARQKRERLECVRMVLPSAKSGALYEIEEHVAAATRDIRDEVVLGPFLDLERDGGRR